MNQHNSDANNAPHAEKLEYEPPMIEQSASFERLMLMCTRQPGNTGLGGPCDPLEGGVASS